jgi:hypothetical protein
MRDTRKAGSTAAVGVRVWGMAVCLSVLLVLLDLLCPPAPATGQSGFTFPLTVPFTGDLPTGWVSGGSATMTSGAGDPVNNGWLRLTTSATSQAGYAYYNTPIPTDRGLVITFDYGAWGGTGADGLTFFLFDGATKTFNVGASGGSLGYAQKTGISGLSGGYLGLGLDEFGNYSNPNEGRIGGPGRSPGRGRSWTGRGTAGYAYLAGTTDLTKSPWLLPRLDCPKNLRELRRRHSAPVRTATTRAGADHRHAGRRRLPGGRRHEVQRCGDHLDPAVRAVHHADLGAGHAEDGLRRLHRRQHQLPRNPQPGRHPAGGRPDRHQGRAERHHRRRQRGAGRRTALHRGAQQPHERRHQQRLFQRHPPRQHNLRRQQRSPRPAAPA